MKSLLAIVKLTYIYSKRRTRHYNSITIPVPLDGYFIGCSFPGSSSGKVSTCNAGNPSLIPGLGRSRGRGDRLPTPVFLGFSGDSSGKKSTFNVGDLGSIPGLGRSPREGKGYPLQYSGLENSMDCIIHGVTKTKLLSLK